MFAIETHVPYVSRIGMLCGAAAACIADSDISAEFFILISFLMQDVVAGTKVIVLLLLGAVAVAAASVAANTEIANLFCHTCLGRRRLVPLTVAKAWLCLG